MEERNAVERLKRGDISGLEELVRRHQLRALRAAYLITRDRALAEDVVQVAFLRAYERIGRFDAQRTFGPWFTKIVVNAAVDAAASSRREVPIEGAYRDLLARLADPQAGPYGSAEEAERRRELREAVEKLSAAQRAAIVQRYYLGMSEAEMSRETNVPPGTIKRRLHDARKKLLGLLRGPSFAVGSPGVPPVAGAAVPLAGGTFLEQEEDHHDERA